MIYAKLNSFCVNHDLLSGGLWSDVWTALGALDEHSALGTTRYQGEAFYLNVHTYETKPLTECRFEGHRDMIDVQYVIKGGEFVDWALKDGLEASGPYLHDRDFQYYHPPVKHPTTRVHLQAGFFGVFFPEDGHRPQINDGVSSGVLKAVVKIHRKLLEKGNI